MELLESLKYVVNFQRFYSLAAFKVNSTHDQFVNDLISWSMFIANIFCYVGAVFILFYLKETFFDGVNSKLFLVITLIEGGLTLLAYIYFVISAFLNRKKQIELLEKILEVDNYMKSSFNLKVNHLLYRNLSILMLTIITIYYNVVILPAVIIGTFRNIFSQALILLAYMVQSTTSGVFAFGYYHYVFLIRQRFAAINNSLTELREMDRQPKQKVAKKQLVKSNIKCQQMMHFTKLYKMLCSSIEDMNDIFGFSMVINFAHDFTLLTTQIFIIFTTLRDERDMNRYNKLAAVLIWLIPNFTKMSITCLMCHLTRNEANTCNQNLKQLGSGSEEEEMEALADIFSLQSIHFQTEFSASNFFPIDMSLFFSIISAITTYLVILIQFQNYESDDINANATVTPSV